ncbi:MAG: peptidoglycan bridge formation glycyltransferase FemA/FemB family protein, partial [Anaerolineales bacterium]
MQLFRGSPAEWNALIASLPMPHILQTWEWAQVKARYGWQPLPFTWQEGGRNVAAAMVLRRALPLRGLAARLAVFYLPKGPNLDWANAPLRERVLNDLQHFARKQGAIFLKLDPDVPLGVGVPGREDAADDPLGQTMT